jgi:long-chain acyl-CoA synthetase
LKKLREELKEDDGVDHSEQNLSEVIQAAEKNEKFMSKIVKQFIDHCLSQSVDRFEAPTRIKFVKEAWIPDSGLVTDSLKIKRKEIDKFYQNEISQLYK